MESKIDKQRFVKMLAKKKDLPESLAMQLVDRIEPAVNQYKQSPGVRREMAGKYARKMLYGFIWALGGTIVTVATYQRAASSSAGGTYIIAWGAILFGIIDFFRGLSGWLKYKD